MDQKGSECNELEVSSLNQKGTECNELEVSEWIRKEQIVIN